MVLSFFTVSPSDIRRGSADSTSDNTSTYAYIIFSDTQNSLEIFSRQNLPSGITSIPALIEDEGTFTVSLDFGDMLFFGHGIGPNDIDNLALVIDNGEELFPNFVIEILEVRLDDSPITLFLNGFTAGEDGDTRYTFYNNSWLNICPREENLLPEWRTPDGLIDPFFDGLPHLFPGDNPRTHGSLSGARFFEVIEATDLVMSQKIEITFNFLAPGTGADIAHLEIQNGSWFAAPNPHDPSEAIWSTDLQGQVHSTVVRERTTAALFGGGVYTVREAFPTGMYVGPGQARDVVQQITLLVYNGSRTFAGARFVFESILVNDYYEALDLNSPIEYRTRIGFHDSFGRPQEQQQPGFTLPNTLRVPIATGFLNEGESSAPLRGLNSDPNEGGIIVGAISDSVTLAKAINSIEITFRVIPLPPNDAVTASLVYDNVTGETAYLGAYFMGHPLPAHRHEGIRPDNAAISLHGTHSVALTFYGATRPASIGTLAVTVFGAEREGLYKGWNLRINSVRLNGIDVLPPEMPTNPDDRIDEKMYRARGYTFSSGMDIRYDIFNQIVGRPPPGARVYDGDGLTGTTQQTIPVVRANYDGTLNPAIRIGGTNANPEYAPVGTVFYWEDGERVPILEITTIVVEFDFLFDEYVPWTPPDWDLIFSDSYSAFFTFATRPDYTHRDEWTHIDTGLFNNNNRMDGFNPRFARITGWDPALDHVDPVPPPMQRRVNYRGTFIDNHRVRASLNEQGRPVFDFSVSMTLPSEPFIPLPAAGANREWAKLAVSTTMPFDLWNLGMILDESFADVTIGGSTTRIPVGNLRGQDYAGNLVISVVNVWQSGFTPALPSVAFPIPTADNPNPIVSISLSLVLNGEPDPEYFMVERHFLREAYNWISQVEQGGFSASTWAEVQSALGVARRYLADSAASQESISNALEALETAFLNLRSASGEVNRNALQRLISSYDNTPPWYSPSTWDFSEYSWTSMAAWATENTWSDFLREFELAKNILSDSSSTQLQINQAMLNLMMTISEVTSDSRVQSDKSALIARIQELRFHYGGYYTEASWYAFRGVAFNRAIEVRDNPHATQEEVDAALYELNVAFEALIRSGNNYNNGCGCGSGNVTAVMIILIATLLGATLLVRKRK